MTDENDILEPEQPRGLYSGFERYATPTDADYRAVMMGGLVVLDTNALLNLYRYTARVRGALIEVLGKIGDQLWEPDQVMLEFWRNREAAIRDYGATARDFDKSVTAALNSTTEAIRALGNRVGLDDDHKKALVGPVEGAYATLSASVKLIMNHDGPAEPKRDTGADPVLAALDPLLQGRVGEALDHAALRVAIAEAKRRVVAQEPPGYKDANKPDGGVGDFLVWRQLLDEAASRSSDALLVTGDVKEDWWRKSDGISVGPRFELLDEFHASVGRRLYLLRPADFLIKAADIFDVQVTAESVAQVRTIDTRPGAAAINPAAAYESAVRKELWGIFPGFVKHASSSDSKENGVDLVLRGGVSQRVAVIVKYTRRIRIEWDWIEQAIQSALNAGYTSLLLICNRVIDEGNLSRLIVFPLHVRCVRWVDSEDDDALSEAVDYLFAVGESADG